MQTHSRKPRRHAYRQTDTLWLQAWLRQTATLAGEATPSFGFVSAFCFTCASCWNETEIKQFGRCRQEILFQFYFSFISVSFYMCGRLNSLKTNAVKKVDPTKKHFFNMMCDLLTGSLILPCYDSFGDCRPMPQTLARFSDAAYAA